MQRAIHGNMETPVEPSNATGGGVVLADGYPSGYSLAAIVLICILNVALMAVIIVGNLLVIISIFSEASLRNIQNWFVASLALADLTLGIFVMPFSLAREVMGYWIFGTVWCQMHSALDVLLCTASIMNICLISLDRYWSITKAVDYIKFRTETSVAVMIFVVWFLSGVVSVPPLFYPPWKLSLEGEVTVVTSGYAAADGDAANGTVPVVRAFDRCSVSVHAYFLLLHSTTT